MLFSVLSTLFAATSALATGCTGNNCDRAVNRMGYMEQHAYECKENLACTVTPAASTTTATTTSYTETITIHVGHTTVSAPESHATTSCVNKIGDDVKQSCNNDFQKYKEACNECLGAYGPTNTAAQPTVTAYYVETRPKVVYA